MSESSLTNLNFLPPLFSHRFWKNVRNKSNTPISDNEKEYKGKQYWTKFTRVKRPQTNGKAERVIRTLMEMWHNVNESSSQEHRKRELIRFVNWYNAVKPHKGPENKTPHEVLTEYFFPSIGKRTSPQKCKERGEI